MFVKAQPTEVSHAWHGCLVMSVASAGGGWNNGDSSVLIAKNIADKLTSMGSLHPPDNVVLVVNSRPPRNRSP
uniref:PPM-type phosphatase domain-containing protein n=1 Tax=Panagrellus redivivus TaxID=6233 RepID=A0A7E4ZZP9_PANRE